MNEESIKRLRLSKRQRELLARVEAFDKGFDAVCDIGCDHGKIAAGVLLKGLSKRVVASDISEKSLEKAKTLFRNLGLANAEFICADGLNGISPEGAGLIIIAGMGGREIIKILSDSKDGGFTKNLLLQPMTDLVLLREYLIKNNYEILHDKIIFDKKFYDIIAVKSGESGLTEAELFFGKTNLEELHRDFNLYIDKEINSLEKILENYSDETLTDYYKKLMNVKSRF
jgi:tRNA (adenine22-N1)-methyltransferase